MTIKVRELISLSIFLAAFLMSLVTRHFYKVETLTPTGQVFYYLAHDFYQLLLPIMIYRSAAAIPPGTPYNNPKIQRILAALMLVLAVASLGLDLYGVFQH